MTRSHNKLSNLLVHTTIMDPQQVIDLHHLSAIRINGRIIYNGVGGNAFAFGDKPDLAAFALGPYPKPNYPNTPQLSKTRTEPCSLKSSIQSTTKASSQRELVQEESVEETTEEDDVTIVTEVNTVIFNNDADTIRDQTSDDDAKEKDEAGYSIEDDITEAAARIDSSNEGILEHSKTEPCLVGGAGYDPDQMEQSESKPDALNEASSSKFEIHESTSLPVLEPSTESSATGKELVPVAAQNKKKVLRTKRSERSLTQVAVLNSAGSKQQSAPAAQKSKNRPRSWAALTNFGSRIAQSTSIIMAGAAMTAVAVANQQKPSTLQPLVVETPTLEALSSSCPPSPPTSHPDPTTSPPPPPPPPPQLLSLPAPLPLPPPEPKPSQPAPVQDETDAPQVPLRVKTRSKLNLITKRSSASSSSSKTSTESSASIEPAPKITLNISDETSQRPRRLLPKTPPPVAPLPPILPRPPAAHLPPPLPSRPPAALLISRPSSPCSSIRSSASARPSSDTTDVEEEDEEQPRDRNKPTRRGSMPKSTPKPFYKRHSRSASFGTKPPDISSAPKTIVTTSFSVMSAATSGAQTLSQENPEDTRQVPETELSLAPTPKLSHHVSASTPNLSAGREEYAGPSSEDEGIYDDANSSGTLSDNAMSAPAPVLASASPRRKKKIFRRRTADSAKLDKPTDSSTGSASETFEQRYDELETKPKRRWFGLRKNKSNQSEDGDKPPSSQSTDSETTKPKTGFFTRKDKRSIPVEKELKQSEKEQKSAKKPKVKVNLDSSPNCRGCGVKFGIRCARQHCYRCKLAYCNNCAPVSSTDFVIDDSEQAAASLARLCTSCKEEIRHENTKGVTRGLWTMFEKMRADARNNRGLDVTSSNRNRQLESQTVLDVTPGLRGLCIRFLVELNQRLQKQPRHKFLHFDSPSKPQQNSKIKVKTCHGCDRHMRSTTDIFGCGICQQVFCRNCVWWTLQVYLPRGTDLRSDIQLETIQFYVKETEVPGKGEIQDTEASEVYRVCNGCEEMVFRNINVYEFDAKIPELEAELFDLQRQIDHNLTLSPYMVGMQRALSFGQVNRVGKEDLMFTCVNHANKLYDRYSRCYQVLHKLMPQTGGQKMLHKHIKQAMYNFYLKRRDQLRAAMNRRDEMYSIADVETEQDFSVR